MSADWADDPNLSRAEILARFAALGPKASVGPHHVAMTWTGAQTIVYIDGKRQD